MGQKAMRTIKGCQSCGARVFGILRTHCGREICRNQRADEVQKAAAARVLAREISRDAEQREADAKILAKELSRDVASEAKPGLFVPVVPIGSISLAAAASAWQYLPYATTRSR